MGTKYDYVALRDEYLHTPGLSIRELAKRHGIPSFSSVAKRAREEDWDAKRREFERQIEDKSLAAIADKIASKKAVIQLDALEVIHAGILKMAEDMDDREPVMDGINIARDKQGEIIWRKAVRYGPTQVVQLIDKFLSLTGQPSQVTEQRNLNLGLSAETDRETMMEILSGLRSRRAIGSAGGRAREDAPAGVGAD